MSLAKELLKFELDAEVALKEDRLLYRHIFKLIKIEDRKEKTEINAF